MWDPPGLGPSLMGDDKQEKMIGRALRRREDERFLTGRGRYVADIAATDALHGHVLRSPHAHARIRNVDVAGAKALPGVRAVYAGQDLASLGTMPCLAAVKPLTAPPRHALAIEAVRHVGEAVAFIVADRREQAREAAEAIVVEYEPLPAVVD